MSFSSLDRKRDCPLVPPLLFSDGEEKAAQSGVNLRRRRLSVPRGPRNWGELLWSRSQERWTLLLVSPDVFVSQMFL